MEETYLIFIFILVIKSRDDNSNYIKAITADDVDLTTHFSTMYLFIVE